MAKSDESFKKFKDADSFAFLACLFDPFRKNDYHFKKVKGTLKTFLSNQEVYT